MEDMRHMSQALSEFQVHDNFVLAAKRAGLVGNAAGCGGGAEDQQTDDGSLSVERGLDAGQTEEEDKTEPESRGQMGQERAEHAHAHAHLRRSTRQANRVNTAPAPAIPPRIPAGRGTLLPSPSFPAPLSPIHTKGLPPPRQPANEDRSPGEQPTPSYTLSPVLPHSPASASPTSRKDLPGPLSPPPPPPPPGDWNNPNSYYYAASYYMAYHNQMYAGRAPPPPPMYPPPYPYGYAAPPMAYGPPGGYYDDGYRGMGYGMPYHPYGYGGPPRSGRSDASYASPISDSPPPRRDSVHNRVKNEDHVPRPKNAFIFYRSYLIKSEAIPHSLEPDHRNLSRIAGEMWRKLSNKEKEPFNQMAAAEKEEHKKKYPHYRYSPAQRTVHQAIQHDASRRRVHRRPEADEEEKRRCAAMADLVRKGITGEKLEEAMKEKGHFVDVSAGIKRKRNRHQVVPESDDEDMSDGPQVAPALRNSANANANAVPSVMRGPEPEAKNDEVQPAQPAAAHPYWVHGPLPFYAGQDDPSAFTLPRGESATTNKEPFQLLSDVPPNGAQANANGSAASNAQAAAKPPPLPTQIIREPKPAVTHQPAPPAPMQNPNGPGGAPEDDMSYYLQGMTVMDGFRR